MPGQATQRVAPCSRREDHEPHPLVGVDISGGEDGWCPGVPARHPDGTLAADEAAAVPLAGELRALTEEVKAAQVAAATELPRLRSNEYELTVHGQPCRIRRITVWRPGPDNPPDKPDHDVDAWHVRVGPSGTIPLYVCERESRPWWREENVTVDARFPFRSDREDDELAALRSAHGYAVEAATMVAGHAGMVAAVRETLTRELALARTDGPVSGEPG